MAKKRYRQPKRIKMHSITERLIVGGLIFLCILLVGFSLYMVLRSVGKFNLHKHADRVASAELTENLNQIVEESAIDSDSVAEEQSETIELKEGQLIYNGEVWQYNEDIMTFLCLGVDARNGVTDEKTPGKAGQADAILLIVANPHTKQLQVINVNRDSMVDIELYDTDGGYAGTENKQIALQYAYGDGRINSCELMESAVSNLFYGIPIHGYAALDMESIPAINDSVGGVEVMVLEDMTRYQSDWVKDAKVLLKGEEALIYIREREDESSELGSNIKRIERQKQYLALFADKLKSKTKEDLTFPLTLYGKVQKHVVTSFSVDEITYLASTLLGYDFSMKNVISIQGEMAMGEINEEFYVNEEMLRALIIETFYEKVE